MGLNGASSGVAKGLKGGGGTGGTPVEGGLEGGDAAEKGGNHGVGLSSFLKIVFLKTLIVLR